MNVSVNGVAVEVAATGSGELAAARELLRQRAVAVGLLDRKATEDGVVNAAIEELLAREVATPSPTEEECRRYYDANTQEFESGDLVFARHILFQVTPQVPIPEIRDRAEQTLNDLLKNPDNFAKAAEELSNCPSGKQGGNLGQIGRGDMVPEFEKALFRAGPSGLQRELVKTRHGFHIVTIDKRVEGKRMPFDMVREEIADYLRGLVEEKALRQYVSVLAGQAEIEGADLNGVEIPLVQ